ncbi:cytochrome c [Parvularcula sp. IMCC14364]|uniref:c-type cytochrome n=1 Tax=Parvularcula sp. IMCC14364 TaxID=3067902 RepID=UPI002740A07F|nr:cytochrome c [Parvularcula sp. IMCC14364]
MMSFRLSTALALTAAMVTACGNNAPEEVDPVAEEVIAVIPEEIVEVDDTTAALAQPPSAITVEVPEVNARRGRILFTVKGCVICHQVNGVGGTAAPALSASRQPESINPLTFTARMWRGAAAMTQLQNIELGYTIELDDQDFADLAAFAESPEEQALFTIDSVGAEMQDWFLNDRYWITGNWEEYKSRGSRIPTLEAEDQ